MSHMSDHGTRISISPSSNQSRSNTTRRSRVIGEAKIMGDYRGSGNSLTGIVRDAVAKVRNAHRPRTSRGSWYFLGKKSRLMLLQRRNAVGHVAVAYICGVDLPEAIERHVGFARDPNPPRQLVEY